MRIRALRKDGKSGQAGLKRLVKENRRKRGGKAVSELQRENNKYIIVAASLGMGVSAEQVMELHRMRWQIELAFKRLKSLFRCNDPPAGNGESVKAWLGNCRLPPCVRHWRAWGGFPPGRDMAAGKRFPPERMSLWREQHIALVMVTGILLDAMTTADLQDRLSRLSNACKNLKRKRLPQLCLFNNSS